MPPKRELSMRQLRHLLRLHHDGVSAREIGRRLGMARGTIQDNLKRATAAGLQWPLPDDVCDDALERQLFGRAGVAPGVRRRVELPYWDDRAGKMEINDGPNGLQRLDFLIAEAGRRHLRLILAFVDFWAYTGGIQQMRAWYGSQDKNRFFFADPRTREDYRRFVDHVLLRRNTITGVVYRDDPTILAWDLANEPNIEPPALMRSWEDDMARFVKSIDPNHLVTSGRANMHVSNTDFDVRALDFLTWHGYPSYLGIPADQFDQAILAHCAAGRAHGKPVLLEEFGNSRDDGNRAAIYAKWLNTIETEPDCAGWVVWRVVSRQDDGAYPADNVDGFDIHNDGGATWLVLQKAARRYACPPLP